MDSDIINEATKPKILVSGSSEVDAASGEFCQDDLYEIMEWTKFGSMEYEVDVWYY